ncbi:MAG: hypothetical protein ABGY75_10425, partial [Gemmataceae bacterium]
MTTGLLLGLFLLGQAKRPVSPAAAIFGLLVGAAVVTAVWLPEVLAEPILAWPWFALVGASATVLAALAGSLFLPARPDGSPSTPANRSPQPGE